MPKNNIKAIFEGYINNRSIIEKLTSDIKTHQETIPEINESDEMIDLELAQAKVDYDKKLAVLNAEKEKHDIKKKHYIEKLTLILKPVIGKWVGIEVSGLKYKIGVFPPEGSIISPYKSMEIKDSSLTLKINKI